MRGQGEFCFLKFALSFVPYTKGGLSILKVIPFGAIFVNSLTHTIWYKLIKKNEVKFTTLFEKGYLCNVILTAYLITFF